MSNVCCNQPENNASTEEQLKTDCTVCDRDNSRQMSEETSNCCGSSEEQTESETLLHEEKTAFRVEGMDCPSCAATIEKALYKLKGILEVNVHYQTAKLQVAGTPEMSLEEVKGEVEKLGYSAEPLQTNKRIRTYYVEGMDCGSCAKSIENHLGTIPSVHDVHVHFSIGKMTVDHDNSPKDIIKEVSKIGYQAVLETKQGEQSGKEHTKKDGYGYIVFTGALILIGFIGSYNGMPALISALFYAAAMVISGYRPVKSAYYAVKSRSLDMNVLMSAAAIGAALIGEWFEGATVVWLFALGTVLQNRSVAQTRKSIGHLMDLAPSEAWMKAGSELIKKPVEEIAVGDTIIIKPGARIPLDGDILSGETSINQASITGESIPVDKMTGDTVYAGTMNESGSLEVKVTKLVEDTSLSKIIHLVEEAQEKKSPTEAFIDTFASIYTPVVFIAALAVMLVPPLFGFGAWGDWIYKGLALLVIACPCALVISTPVAIVSAIGNAAKNGVLIKGGTFLEKAGAIHTMAFDKTGTLTEGKPKVADIIPVTTTEQELLSIAFTLEDYSAHPIAKTIVAYAKEQGIPSRSGASFQAIPGKGVQATIAGNIYYGGNVKLFEAMHTQIHSDVKADIEKIQNEGKSIVIIGTETEITGIISVADTLRATSSEALNALKQTGVKQLVMLTGDNEGTAKMIAGETAVNRYFAGLLPEEKVEAVKQLQKEGNQVAMVGDGMNDAPALATADLGIAMGGAGTDTAMETADIVLMADNLEQLPHTVKLSRKALTIIKQNIWFSLLIKLVALSLIFPEWLTLWMAVLSDTGAAVIVILNALRLLKVKG